MWISTHKCVTEFLSKSEMLFNPSVINIFNEIYYFLYNIHHGLTESSKTGFESHLNPHSVSVVLSSDTSSSPWEASWQRKLWLKNTPASVFLQIQLKTGCPISKKGIYSALLNNSLIKSY